MILAVLIERLGVYNRETKPVSKYYSEQNILNVIDGMGTIEEVSSYISMIIKKDFKVGLDYVKVYNSQSLIFYGEV